jgi:methionyl-tRNA formyltransferase
MYHGIASEVDMIAVIIEDKPDQIAMLKRRAKKLGIFRCIGQLLFVLFNRFLYKFSKPRIIQLIEHYQLQDKDFPSEIVMRVKSVNSEETIDLLKKLNPDLVIVNGTRIISGKVLSAIEAPFVNTHMGITPRYRGVHGGYWALAKGDSENCGITVHLVDQGIDTGGVLYQGRIQIEPQDNFNTYPIHKIAKAIPLMKAVLRDVRENKLTVVEGVQPSNIWFHPTIWEYISNRLFKGVK